MLKFSRCQICTGFWAKYNLEGNMEHLKDGQFKNLWFLHIIDFIWNKDPHLKSEIKMINFHPENDINISNRSTKYLTIFYVCKCNSKPGQDDFPIISTKKCIPVGCVRPACWPYLVVSHWGGERGSAPRESASRRVCIHGGLHRGGLH